MKLSRAALLFIVLGLTVPAAAADAAGIVPGDVEPTGTPNAAYLDAVSWHGLQPDVVYLRPGAPLPEGEVAVPGAPGLPDSGAERRNWAIAAGVILASVLAFAAWYGRGIPVSFRSARDPLRRRAPAASHETPAGDLPPTAFLASLAAMPDRRRALVLLVGRALERAAEANGLRLGRAQTARDVLRVLPRGWPHLDALRRLVFEAEIVHFGGRDLPEDRWLACLETARPVFAAGRPG